MQFNVEAQVENREIPKQKQGLRARVLWILMIVSTPVLSPIYLVILLIYQFCCVGRQRLSLQAKAVTAVLSIFFIIAPIPIVNLALYRYISDSINDGDLQASASDRNSYEVNSISPIVAFTIFCVWGSLVAFRHFSIADSYEPETERSSVKRLAEIEFEHPLVVPCASQLGNFSSLTSVSGGGACNASSSAPPEELHSALDLYLHLKGPVQYTIPATLIAIVMSGATVGIVRYFNSEPHTQDDLTKATFYLSTVFFSGMFLVFYSTFAFIITLYLHQVHFIQRLTYSIQENDRPAAEHMVVRVEAFDRKHLRAWEECRRLAVDALTSPQSILNSFFTPSMWLSALSSIFIYMYLVVALLFQRKQGGQFTTAMIILLVTFMIFMFCALVVAKLAQKHFKLHTAIVAQRTFDIARRIDVYHTNIEQGIDNATADDGEHSVSGQRVKNIVARRRARSDSIISDQQLSLTTMEQIYVSLHSLCTFMVANQPRPLLLGIELRHVRYLVVFLMLINGNILFVSLMVAFKQNNCTPSTLAPNATTPGPAPTLRTFM